MEKKPKILFLCTGSPARSGMAEGFLREMAGDDVISESTSVEATSIDGLAVQVMHEAGIDISGQHPKTRSEALRDTFASVVMIFDKAIERSPVFPFTLRTLKWSIEDPALVSPAEGDRLSNYRRTRDNIRRCVGDFLRESGTRRQLAVAHG